MLMHHRFVPGLAIASYIVGDDLVLGLLIAIQWPASGVWVIGLFLGIDLIFIGVAMLLLATHRSQLTAA